MPSLLEQSLAREMQSWESAGLRRELGESQPGRVDFASNDYLHLARSPEVIEAAQAALADHGAGARASRLLGGGSPLHERAERAAAEWVGAEAALLFPSGYQANLGVIGALAGRGDALFCDRLIHASLIDGARLSRARVFVHPHLDTDELGRQLGRAGAARRRLVVTEGVFSMDGDRAPLTELHELCERYDAWLVVDEAHSLGLLGPEGAGAWAALGREAAASSRLAARILTGGKALGVGGAFVTGGAALREHLVNRSRPFVFTTAPSPATAGALLRAIELCRAADRERARVLALARTLAGELGLPAPDAAIVPLVVGASQPTLALAEQARREGFDVRAVRPPSVPEGSARLRLVAHAANTAAEVDDLARTLRKHGAPTRRVAPAPRAAGQPLFVVGTDTGIGKTLVSALLLRAARRLGPAAYWKPVQTGPDSDTDTVGRLAGAKPHELLRPAWTLGLPASPHEAAAAEEKEIRPEHLEEGLAGLRRTMPDARLVVELAGGLHVPYRLREGAAYTQADWLERARVGCVLVARSGLGTLNHTLLTLEALRARHVEPRALFLVGERHASNRETLRELSGAPVFELPPLDPLTPDALVTWLEANDLRGLFA